MAEKTKDLLPPNLQGDKTVEGLCGAIDAAFGIEGELDKLLMYDLDRVPKEILPFLAWHFHVEGWDLVESEQEQRALIRNAGRLHRYKGTPWSVENALQSVGIDAQLTEWFQYGGDPGKFRVAVDVQKTGVDADLINLIEGLIDQHKNERSWLDALILYLAARGTATLGAAVLSGELVTVYPYQQTTLEESAALGLGGAFPAGVETVTIYPLEA